jgi:hypothetical protein
MAFEDGPFISACCFCDMAIKDVTGTLSLIRIIDVITHAGSGPNPPVDMPAFDHELKLVIILRSGMARGRSMLKIVPEEPDGSSGKPLELSVHFDGEEKGANVVIDLRYRFKLEGLYWFDVYIDDQKINSIPLRIKYQRMISGG